MSPFEKVVIRGGALLRINSAKRARTGVVLWMENLLLKELIDTVAGETAAYTEILKLSRVKTDVIVKGNIPELENMTRLEQDMVTQVSRMENSRQKLVDKLLEKLGADPAEKTVTALIKLLPTDQADRLGGCCKKLSNALKVLDSVNKLNSRLIGNSLEYINFSINLFASVSNTNNMYGNSGQASDSRKRNLFDMKL